GLRSRDVRVGLTGSRVVVRVVDLPAMPDHELAGAVRFSAADHIPIPLDEAVLDQVVLEPAPPAEPGGPPMVRVLVAAAHRSALDGLLAAVAAGGLRAVAVDLVPFALVRALATPAVASADPADGSGDPGPAPAEAIVSVGAGLTTVVVHEAGRPRFVRTVPVGGEMLTAAVAEELGLDAAAAEAAKRDSHGAGEPGAFGSDNDLARRAARVVELRLAGILGEIQSGLAYWMAQAERPLRRIVLTGGGARAGDIAGRLALLVGAPVEWGAVHGLEAPEPAAGAGDWDDLGVAAGLALGAGAGGWQIDLCPPVKRAFRFTGDMARRLAVAAVVVVVLLAGLSIRSVTALGREQSRLAAQKKANARVEAEIVQFDSLRKLSTDLDVGRHRVQSALTGDVSWSRFLSDLVRSMPSGVWLQTLSVQTNSSASAASSSAPKAPPTAGATAAAAINSIGSMQVAATGLDFPAVADWLHKVGADPSLAGLAVGGLTATSAGTTPTVAFTSTATLTPAAHSDRAATLAKAAL
ncbi:MAG TPA: pilus assembly protein PilM, partial [Acidimicrobiia bacterium]|nr:pilus assembly protein PilM [Acidimicrobiia bacterium]